MFLWVPGFWRVLTNMVSVYSVRRHNIIKLKRLETQKNHSRVIHHMSQGMFAWKNCYIAQNAMGILFFFLTTTLNIHYPKAKLLSRKMYKVGCICHSHFPRMHCKAGDEKQCPEDLVDCLCEGKEHTLMVDAVFNQECNGCDAWKLLLRSPPRYHLNCACRCSFSQDGPRALQTQEENWIWNTELWSMAVLLSFCKKKKYW